MAHSSARGFVLFSVCIYSRVGLLRRIFEFASRSASLPDPLSTTAATPSGVSTFSPDKISALLLPRAFCTRQSDSPWCIVRPQRHSHHARLPRGHFYVLRLALIALATTMAVSVAIAIAVAVAVAVAVADLPSPTGEYQQPIASQQPSS